MRRRQFITLVGSAAASWPLVASAQQAPVPVIGWLSGWASETDSYFLTAFMQGLKELGYVEGQNVAIERRRTDQYDRLPALAADLVRRQVAVIATAGSPASPIAAKAATATIPIVFAIGGDPVKLGLVLSLNRPSGNLTGVSFLVNSLGAKRLDLMGELLPMAATFGFLVDPTNPGAEDETRDTQAAADTLKRKLLVVRASTEDEVDGAFAIFVRERVDAVIVAAEAFFVGRRYQLASLTAQHALPAIYHLREFAAAGGLMSYGTSFTDGFRQAGRYAGRVLKGEKPAELPVMQSTRFELVINLNAAKALGLGVPNSLLVAADEVIE
jgi:putative tryptophan/tyrosine transport system substrate-binding protein